MSKVNIFPGSIKLLIKEIEELNYKNYFIVTGKNSFKSSTAHIIFKTLSKKYNLIFFDNFDKNPKFSDAIRGAQIFEKNKCQCIISIGGGSVIDMGKLINAFQAYKGREYDLIKGKLKIRKKLMYSIAVPTTAGTGSEATHFAVVYYRNQKYSLASQNLLANFVIVDSNLMKSMTKYLAASTAFDAFTQSIESMWSVNATKESKKFSSKAIKLLMNNLYSSVNKKNYRSIENLAIAAHYSGKAINITKTTAPHALSYTIALLLGISHGHSVALTLGYFFEINENSGNLSKLNSNHKLSSIMKNIYKLMMVTNAKQAKKKWFEMMNKCELEYKIEKFKLDDKKINRIINSVNLERLNNHPVQVSKSEMKKIFYFD